MSDSTPENPSINGRDLGAELAALNDQLRSLSRSEADRLERVLADNPNVDPEQRAHLESEISRFRQIAATELE